eukprot:TRINITY_DN2172_c0_g1_i2.p1 TRINITY_DN2172_c0_g1~~TRINITY_DN2172_c0_g1_i2.p1  ORF type:complete len:78 (+),score=18.17 TRINITY_DN2172_c0_g1_i2:237-470(+)
MRAAGHDGMTDDEVALFVDTFMPAYRQYLPALYADGLTQRKLQFRIEPSRLPAPCSLHNSTAGAFDVTSPAPARVAD